MSIKDSQFNSQALVFGDGADENNIGENTEIDKLAENVNYLNKLATGSDVPGGANPLASGHNHSSIGPKIPRAVGNIIGYISHPFCTGEANDNVVSVIPHCRVQNAVSMTTADVNNFLTEVSATPLTADQGVVLNNGTGIEKYKSYVQATTYAVDPPSSVWHYVTNDCGTDQEGLYVTHRKTVVDSGDLFIPLYTTVNDASVSSGNIRYWAVDLGKNGSSFRIYIPDGADVVAGGVRYIAIKFRAGCTFQYYDYSSTFINAETNGPTFNINLVRVGGSGGNVLGLYNKKYPESDTNDRGCLSWIKLVNTDCKALSAGYYDFYIGVENNSSNVFRFWENYSSVTPTESMASLWFTDPNNDGPPPYAWIEYGY